MTFDGTVVRFDLEDGTSAELHVLALRDACPCAECSHPVSGQRLFESSRVLAGVHAESARANAAGGLEIEWADGHRSTFPAEWVRAEANAAARGRRPSNPVRTWGAEIAREMPEHEWPAVSSDPAARRAWLRDASVLGFALLHGVPCEPGSVEAVARTFGAVRETNYGRVFDVSVAIGATNLADTLLPLSVHTDNPYREPTPTLQLLHCLESAVDGGNTILVDGFAAVARLRERNERLLATLASEPIRFAYRDGAADLCADVPVVTLDAHGDVTALHLNNRSKGIPYGNADRVAVWYEAYLALLEILESPDLALAFRLAPGDLVLFDNSRVLHGRTGFAGEGRRRPQGCYADRDALRSSLAVLEREPS